MLNDRISEAAYQFADELAIPPDEVVQASQICYMFDPSEPWEKSPQNLLGPFLELCARDPAVGVEHAIREITKALVHVALRDTIFKRFVPFFKGDSLNSWFVNLHGLMKKQGVEIL